VPMLFQGEEWAASTPFLYFTDHPDPELGKAVSEGRKGEFAAFGWDPSDIPDPQDPKTFERSKLDWSETERGVHAELLAWHKELIRFRKASPPPTELGEVTVRHDEAGRWLIADHGSVTVICNLSTDEVEVDHETEKPIALASSYEPKRSNGSLSLPPESVTIYSD
jgi:maltooligosyltrehalose trehalohydrolase